MKIKFTKVRKRKIRGRQRIRWLDDITDSVDMKVGNLQEMAVGGLASCSPWGHRELDVTWQLNTHYAPHIITAYHIDISAIR